MFVLGAVIMVGGAAVVFYDVLNGTNIRLPLGQVFVGASWTAVLVGMLGLYPEILDERPWLARAGAITAVIGVFGYAVMTVLFASAVVSVPMSSLEPLQPVFFLPMLVGTFLAFPLFAVAGILTGAYSRVVSVLLAAPTVIFVANVITGTGATSIFAVQIALIIVFGATGYLLRVDGASVDGRSATTDTTV